MRTEQPTTARAGLAVSVTNAPSSGTVSVSHAPAIQSAMPCRRERRRHPHRRCSPPGPSATHSPLTVHRSRGQLPPTQSPNVTAAKPTVTVSPLLARQGALHSCTGRALMRYVGWLDAHHRDGSRVCWMRSRCCNVSFFGKECCKVSREGARGAPVSWRMNSSWASARDLSDSASLMFRDSAFEDSLPPPPRVSLSHHPPKIRPSQNTPCWGGPRRYASACLRFRLQCASPLGQRDAAASTWAPPAHPEAPRFPPHPTTCRRN